MILAETESGYQIEMPILFDDYKVLGYEQKGCFSVVFKVVNIITNNIYAAKVISKDDMEMKNCLDDINNEITIHSQLTHPNIVNLSRSLDIINSKKEVLVVLIEEYCQKGNLHSYFNKFGFKNEQEMKNIEIGIINSIMYLHKMGYAHCDIKPENILLDGGMNPKLCDFGCCEYCGNSINHNFFKSDIWSIGQILYNFSEKKKLSFNSSVETKDIKLKNLVEKCISIDLSKRPSIFELLDDDYFRIDTNRGDSSNDQKENAGIDEINATFSSENID